MKLYRPSVLVCGSVIVTLLIALPGAAVIAAEDTSQKEKSTGLKIEYAPIGATTAKLRKYFADQSLNGDVGLQSRDRLVFIQTFPYSGVRASHLFVYAKRKEYLAFHCFFNVPTQAQVELKAARKGSIEIRAEGKVVGILPQPTAR